MTTSGSGILGNFGQCDDATAKTAMLGCMNCLASEGARKNVRINAIKPAAATRMAQGVVCDAVLANSTLNSWRRRSLPRHAGRAARLPHPSDRRAHLKASFAQTPGIDLSGDAGLESFAAAWRDIFEGPLEPVRHQPTA